MSPIQAGIKYVCVQTAMWFSLSCYLVGLVIAVVVVFPSAGSKKASADLQINQQGHNENEQATEQCLTLIELVDCATSIGNHY